MHRERVHDRMTGHPGPESGQADVLPLFVNARLAGMPRGGPALGEPPAGPPGKAPNTRSGVSARADMAPGCRDPRETCRVQVVYKVCIERERPKIPPSVPKGLRRLLERSWHPDAHRRPSCAEIHLEAIRLLRELGSPNPTGLPEVPSPFGPGARIGSATSRSSALASPPPAPDRGDGNG